MKEAYAGRADAEPVQTEIAESTLPRWHQATEEHAAEDEPGVGAWEVGSRLSGYRLMQKVCVYRVPGLFAAVNHLQCEPESCATDSSPDGGIEGRYTMTVKYLFHPFLLVTMNPSLTSSYSSS